eukprot:gene14714-29575_t
MPWGVKCDLSTMELASSLTDGCTVAILHFLPASEY